MNEQPPPTTDSLNKLVDYVKVQEYATKFQCFITIKLSKVQDKLF